MKSEIFKIIRKNKYLVISAMLSTIFIEIITLAFTNNKMYGIVDDDLYECEYLQDNNSIYIQDLMNDTKSINLYFKQDCKISKITCQFILDDTIYFQTWNGQFGQNKFAFVSPIDKCSQIIVTIDDYKNYDLDSIKLSEKEPPVVKMRLINIWRILFYFFMILFLLARRNEIVSRMKHAGYILRQFNKSIMFVLSLEIMISIVTYFLYKENKLTWAYILLIDALIFVIFMTLLLLKGKIVFNKYFFIVGVSMALVYIMLQPVFTYGGDAYIHFSRALQDSNVYDTNRFTSYDGFLDENANLKYEDLCAIIDRSEESMYLYKESIWPRINLRHIAYLPYIIAFSVADGFNLSPYYGYQLGLLFAMLLYFIIIYYSLRKLASGKYLLAVYSLVPSFFYLYCSYTYTSWLIIWYIYAFASLISIAQDKEAVIMKRDAFKILFALIIGSLPKSPYCFVFLLVFVLPLARYRGDISRKKMYLYTLLAFLFVMATLIVPMLLNPDGMDMYSDTRGGEGVEALGQLKFAISEPLCCMKNLLKGIWDKFRFSNFVLGRDGMLAFRTRVQVRFGWIFISVFLFMVLFDHNQKQYTMLSVKNKLFSLVWTSVIVLVIAMVLYMNYSEVGVDDNIKGLSPKYFLVFMYPSFYFCGLRINNDKIRKFLTNNSLKNIMIGICFIWQVANIYFCLLRKYIL